MLCSVGYMWMAVLLTFVGLLGHEEAMGLI